MHLVKFLAVFLSMVGLCWSDLLGQGRNRGATLKPISACCDIPELGNSKPLLECSTPKLPGPCNDVQCVFEKSGFLSDKNTLNKEAYRNHLRQWSETHKGWSEAVDKAIKDCVDKDLRQYLSYPCRAYDVFTCTGIAMLKPFGVETLGPWGPGAHTIFKDLSKLLKESTGDKNAGFYFGQRISIAIQRGNAASILGTLPSGDGLDF